MLDLVWSQLALVFVKMDKETTEFSLFGGSEAKKDRLKFLKMTKNGKNLTGK